MATKTKKKVEEIKPNPPLHVLNEQARKSHADRKVDPDDKIKDIIKDSLKDLINGDDNASTDAAPAGGDSPNE